ncbi:MAG: PAC2 family protein, partial [Nocardioides sp.]|nr:PAC2 family protein [Nocardioides sp.]
MSSRLVHIVDDIPAELREAGGVRLPMVAVLDGFLDAGNAAVRASTHLVEVSKRAPVVATFDVDEFHDYRARRPAVSFVRDHYEGYDAPRLVVRMLKDAGDTPYLLLHGPEPDNRWEAFAGAVREVVERFGVTEMISLGSVPMAIPHTRPMTVTHHANDAALDAGVEVGESPWNGEIRVPSSAQALVEIRLGEWGHAAHGFVAHVPHYLAQTDFPAASAALIGLVERAGRLTIPLSDLEAEAERREEEVTAYLQDNTEVAEVVAALERQYDTFQRAEESGRSLLAPDQPLPTGDELGQEFERFLAGLGESGHDAGDHEDRPGPDGPD